MAMPGSDARSRGRRIAWRSRARRAVPIMLSLLAGLILWQLAISYLQIPAYVLPSPGKVWAALVDGLSTDPFSRASFWYHLEDTLQATLIGFLIGSVIGIVLASLMAEFAVVEAAAMPYVIGLQSLPKVAIAPLLVIWLGFGIESKIAMAAILALFPVLINTHEGLRGTERDRIELMVSLRATRFQTFRYISLPGALPMIFAGLNLGIVYALLGTLVSEFIGAQRGMGVIMTQLQVVSDTAGVFAAMVVLAVTGYILIAAMQAIQHRVVFWAASSKPRE
jgi:NitT/TauT family transport system permease protein